MIVVIERDYYGDIIDIYGPFATEAAAQQFTKDMGLNRSETFLLTSPGEKATQRYRLLGKP